MLLFPTLRSVSPLLFILQGIAAGIGTSNFLRAALTMSLNSSSFGSIKNIPLNCLTLSSFGFSMAHLCFAFFFVASDTRVHKSGQTSSRREVFCFLVGLTHVCPSGGLSFFAMNLVKLVHASDNSFFSIHVPVIFNRFLHHNIQGCMSRSGNVDVLRRNRKCFFFRHVQFDSWYNLMTINECPCDRPEISSRFLIIRS